MFKPLKLIRLVHTSKTRPLAGVHRLYSTNIPPPRPNIKLFVGIGTLVVSGTLASFFYNNKLQSLAESKLDVPAFTSDQISVIFVLGGPGAGKGTQCAKLVNEKEFIHLSAGDLLRAEQNRKGSKYGELIASYIKEGLIVPQEVTVALLQQAINENYKKGSNRFLVDGFPRKMDQALTFEQQIVPSSFTLFFECPENVMLQRLLERGKTSGRTDDNIESIKKRFRTFIETSLPVVEYFEKQNKVVKVRCDQSVDEVYHKVVQALKEKGL